MTIEEAIAHAHEVAEGCQAEDRQFAYQHDKLADWLEELKAYRETGLTPEEIVKLKSIKNYADAVEEQLLKYIQEEKEGRLVAVPPNDPLTREELRRMPGEPVWVERKERSPRWTVIRFSNDYCLATVGCGLLSWDDQGDSWDAYRRKPEEREGGNNGHGGN